MHNVITFVSSRLLALQIYLNGTTSPVRANVLRMLNLRPLFRFGIHYPALINVKNRVLIQVLSAVIVTKITTEV